MTPEDLIDLIDSASSEQKCRMLSLLQIGDHDYRQAFNKPNARRTVVFRFHDCVAEEDIKSGNAIMRGGSVNGIVKYDGSDESKIVAYAAFDVKEGNHVTWDEQSRRLGLTPGAKQ
jgi:hypothetical protein